MITFPTRFALLLALIGSAVCKVEVFYVYDDSTCSDEPKLIWAREYNDCVAKPECTNDNLSTRPYVKVECVETFPDFSQFSTQYDEEYLVGQYYTGPACNGNVTQAFAFEAESECWSPIYGFGVSATCSSSGIIEVSACDQECGLCENRNYLMGQCVAGGQGSVGAESFILSGTCDKVVKPSLGGGYVFLIVVLFLAVAALGGYIGWSKWNRGGYSTA